MKRWSHLHSLGAGAVIGFGAATQAWLVVLAALAVGVLLGRFWWLLHRARVEAVARLRESHERKLALEQARLKTEQARATELRTRTRHRAKPRRLQDAEVKRAYIAGATDRLHELGPGYSRKVTA